MAIRYEITGTMEEHGRVTLGYWFTDKPIEDVSQSLANAINMQNLNYWDIDQQRFTVMTNYSRFIEISIRAS